MKFNLRYFREDIMKLTQKEFADMMSKSQNTISRWEKEPDSLTIEILAQISKETGYDISDLLNTRPKVNIPWEVDTSQWNKLRDFEVELYNSRNELNYFINKNDCLDIGVFKNIYEELDNLYCNMITKIKKPKVAFLGNSDVGKSTLINSILGDDILPAGWSPITSVIIKVAHLEDKPEFLEEDNTVIFSKAEGGIDTAKLKNEKYFNKYFIESGDKNLLEKYGSREGEMYGKNSNAEVIVIYIDSPILKTCELWDLPGYGTADDPCDDLKASKGKDNADIFVYMSLASAFMRGPDMTYLKDIKDTMNPLESKDNNMEPLCNLFVIASQAHVVKPVNTLKSLIAKGSDRMNSVLPDNYWDNRGKTTGINYDKEVFNKRFFSFTRDNNELSQEFKVDFIKLLEQISLNLNVKLKEKLKFSISEVQKKIIEEIEKVEIHRKDMSKALQEYEEIKSMQQNVYEDNEKFIKNLERELNLYKKESVVRFKEFYDDFISEDSIVNIIRRKWYRNKRKDKEELQNFISNNLTQELNEIAQYYSERLKKYLDKELQSLNMNIGNTNTFDYKRAFASGLVGASTYGAFALYIGTLGNLGGYILVTKAVGLLSTIGISVGGGAVATSAVAAIGGPITIVLGLSVLAGTAASIITGLNWEKRLAKSLVNAYDKQDAKEQYCESLIEWWKETENAITKDMMIVEYEKKLKSAKDRVNVSDVDLKELENCLKNLHNLIA